MVWYVGIIEDLTMYITKIDNSRKNVFFAAMPEQKIIEGIQGIIRKKAIPIAKPKMDYFVDMQKAANKSW